MVAFGTLLSATLILSVNSWDANPAGIINDVGQFIPRIGGDRVQTRLPLRLLHMVMRLVDHGVVVGARAVALL